MRANCAVCMVGRGRERGREGKRGGAVRVWGGWALGEEGMEQAIFLFTLLRANRE